MLRALDWGRSGKTDPEKHLVSTMIGDSVRDNQGKGRETKWAITAMICLLERRSVDLRESMLALLSSLHWKKWRLILALSLYHFHHYFFSLNNYWIMKQKNDWSLNQLQLVILLFVNPDPSFLCVTGIFSLFEENQTNIQLHCQYKYLLFMTRLCMRSDKYHFEITTDIN